MGDEGHSFDHIDDYADGLASEYDHDEMAIIMPLGDWEDAPVSPGHGPGRPGPVWGMGQAYQYIYIYISPIRGWPIRGW